MGLVNVMVPNGVMVLGAEAIHRIVTNGSGDAALLYLHLLDHSDAEALRWPAERISAAANQLRQCGLLCDRNRKGQTQTDNVQRRSVVVDPVPFERNDVVEALQDGMEFPKACNMVQECIGKRLTVYEMQKVHQIYECLNQDLELLNTFLTNCAKECEQKHGEGRRPNLTILGKEASKWGRNGIDTISAAQAYIRTDADLKDKGAEILRLLDIKPHPLIDQEKEYIDGWLKMGFPNQSIRYAYERTILRIKGFDWNYMDTILRNWHRMGLHTVEEIKRGDRKPPTPLQAGVGVGKTQAARYQEDMERTRRLLEEMKKAEQCEG